MQIEAPEYCLFAIPHWSTCMTKAEWSGWMQAIFSVLAIVAAIVYPAWQAARARRATRQGHLETIAMDVLLAERQANVYIESKFKVPAYRLPLYGRMLALPALLAEGQLNRHEATALAQFYVDATSFNYCLDRAQETKSAGGNWTREVNRIELKARHLVSGTPFSRYDGAISVLRRHLPKHALQRLTIEGVRDEVDEESL